ncbi:MAG: GNAT family N-acetyltransferase [Oscillospiraceae bacterium]|nr:GNAT family N-acetyltransferase [Oscillospiraceae bacterium]
MKEIEPQALLERIRPRRLCYFTEYLDLTRPEALENYAIRCYANGDKSCHAMTWQYPKWNVANFIGYDRDFTREVLRRFGETEACWPLPREETPPNVKLRGLRQKAVSYEFAYEDPMPEVPIDPHICLLEKEQFAPLRAIAPRQDDLDHKPLAFAWMEGGQPLGYLACGPMVEDIWDVGLVFTLPEHRGRGIATKLAYAYLKTMRERGLVPYYSGVTNPASAAAARKAGFQLCRTDYLFHYKRPKFKP